MSSASPYYQVVIGALRACILLVMHTIALHTAAQDVHFSQYHNAPLWLNPSLAGDIEGDQRAALSHREQWRSAGASFRTQAFSYDAPLFRGRFKGRYLGLGANFFTDRAGRSRFGDTQGNLSIAYATRAGRSSYMALGLQVGYGQRSASLSGLRWDEQYNGNGYDPAVGTAETTTGAGRDFMDVGAGAMCKGSSGKMRWKYGLSVFHLNRPNVSLIGSPEDRLIARFATHGEVQIEARRWTWWPKLLLARQGGATELNYGMLLHRRIGQDSRYTNDRTSSAFYMGCFHRWGDAIIPTVVFEWQRKLVAGMSYDVNISGLRAQTRMRGGMELAVQWIGLFREDRVKLPKGKKE
jgi:type IX secretion system PorP/SprF family membrane protein